MLSCFAFVTYPGATADAEDPVVWFLSGNPVFISTGLTVLFSLLVFAKNIFQFDKVDIWLFLRIFFCLFPLLYITNTSSFSAHYPVVILSFLAYIIGRYSKWSNEHTAGSILIIFGVVLSIQTLLTANEIPVPFFSLEYKRYMRIPIAASNVIAAYIVPVFFLFVFNYRPKRLIKIALIVLFIGAVLMTKSRGGISCIVLGFVLYLVFFKYKFNLLYIIPVAIVFGVIIYYLLEIPEVKMFMLGFHADDINVTANQLSSNRFNIFEEEFNRFLENPIFGNGMVFNDTTSRSGSHNLIIELLVQSGLVGFVLYLLPIIFVFKHSIKYECAKDMLGWQMFIITTLLHGMIEVNFFNYSTDIIFWSVCGLIMTCKRHYLTKPQIHKAKSNSSQSITYNTLS